MKAGLLLNPRMPEEQAASLRAAWRAVGEAAYPEHIAIATSGTSGGPGNGPGKLVALSRAALEASARAVNENLQSSARDVWFKTLPDFHVGGLGIRVRAALSGARVVESEAERWEPRAFAAALAEAGATLVSLVPTQLFDLVRAGLSAPPALRAALVGGGALAPELYFAARDLGWPALTTYGLSECASSVANAPLASLQERAYPALELLAHVRAEIDSDGRLRLSSPALFSGYVLAGEDGVARAEDPKRGGWFTTEDRAEIDGRRLRPLGRSQDFLKIGGEQASFARLEAIFERAKLEVGAADVAPDVALVPAPDARLGHAIHLLYAARDRLAADAIRRAYDRDVHPFERVRAAHACDAVPRSALGKVLRAKALALVSTGERKSE